MQSSIELIEAERARQIAKGWTMAHDATHTEGALALAAACYAVPPAKRQLNGPSALWPFELKDWKPTPNNRRRELVKAAALLAAEIDRLSLQEAIEGHWETPQQAVDFCRSASDPDYVVTRIAQHNLSQGEIGFSTELLMLFRNQCGVQVATEIDEGISKAPLLPPYPPVPEGFTRWVARGYGWESGRKVTCAWINPSDDKPEWHWPREPHCPSGFNSLFYLEAIVAKKARIPVGMEVYRDHRTFDWPAEWSSVVFTVPDRKPPGASIGLKAPGFGAMDDYGSGAVWIQSAQVKDLIPVED